MTQFCGLITFSVTKCLQLWPITLSHGSWRKSIKQLAYSYDFGNSLYISQADIHQWTRTSASSTSTNWKLVSD